MENNERDERNEKTCEELIPHMWEATRETLRRYLEPREDTANLFANGDNDNPSFWQWPLSFEYTEKDDETKEPAYFRLLLSWGGPSDDIRFYPDQRALRGQHYTKIMYYYMDWFDGASLDVTGTVEAQALLSMLRLSGAMKNTAALTMKTFEYRQRNPEKTRFSKVWWNHAKP